MQAKYQTDPAYKNDKANKQKGRGQQLLLVAAEV
jgi:hypothetical protein